MRDPRRLPPLLRVASVLKWLFPLAAIELLVVTLAPYLLSVGLLRMDKIVLNLLLLSWACSFAVSSYRMRFGQPGGGPFLLDSWQSQVWAIGLLSALPLCGITLALIFPSTSRGFLLVFVISFLAVCGFVVARLWQIAKTESRGPMRTPPTG